MANEASVGGFLSETTAVIAGKATECGLYVVVIGGLAAIGVIFGWADPSSTAIKFGFNVNANNGLIGALFGLVSAVVNIVAGYLMLREFLAGRGRLRDGGKRFWPYVGMSILSAIGLVLGLILLIVPGVILMIRWSAASGFLIGDGEGVTDALSKSWQATKGHSWAIFFAALILFFGVGIVDGVVSGLFGILGGMAGSIASAFVEAAASTALMAFGIGVYCLVHDNTEELSEVFA
jgi:hypothetical protein